MQSWGAAAGRSPRHASWSPTASSPARSGRSPTIRPTSRPGCVGGWASCPSRSPRRWCRATGTRSSSRGSPCWRGRASASPRRSATCSGPRWVRRSSRSDAGKRAPRPCRTSGTPSSRRTSAAWRVSSGAMPWRRWRTWRCGTSATSAIPRSNASSLPTPRSASTSCSFAWRASWPASRSDQRPWHGTWTASAARSSPSRSCWRWCVAACGATTRIASCSATRSRATISSDACATIRRSRESFRHRSSRVSLTCATPCGISTVCSRGRWRTAMDRGELLYEGKAKQVYRTSDPALLIQHFKDDATAFNAQKRGTIVEKRIVNNRISEVLFGVLEQHGIATHFVRRLSDRDMLVRACQIVKIEVVVRNIIAGSLATRLGRPEGEVLAEPVLEHYLKDDALGDPLINDWHIRLLRLATAEELAEINATALRVNDLLRAFLDAREIVLVDFKLEFGRHAGRLLVADEIGPDTCRLWDKSTQRKLDKDRFRRDLGAVEEAYQEAARRICGIAA